MKIQVGEIYMDKVTNEVSCYFNKTRKYLLPCLKEYGPGFMARFESVFKVAVGIGDIVISNRGLKHEKHVFVLLDSMLPKTGKKNDKVSPHFLDFMEYIRKEPMYEDDYVFDNIQKSTSHMVILKLPEKYYDTFESFKLSQYSKMYDKGDITRLFSTQPSLRKVLVKDHNYRIIFVGKLNREWGTSINPKDWEGELAHKIDENEVFNHHIPKK